MQHDHPSLQQAQPVTRTGRADLRVTAVSHSYRAADVFDDLIAVALHGSGFLSHLHSSVATIDQKPSFIKSA